MTALTLTPVTPQVQALYPSNTLFPSASLFPRSGPRLAAVTAGTLTLTPGG